MITERIEAITNALKILEHSQKRIENPACWTKGCLALTKEDRPCTPESPFAVKWNMEGSVLYSEWVLGIRKNGKFGIEIKDRSDLLACHFLKVARAIVDSEHSGEYVSLPPFGGRLDTTHESVMAIFNGAVKLCKELLAGVTEEHLSLLEKAQEQ